MEIRYFEDTDTLYIELRAAKIAETRDLDATDDPLHGPQEGRLFHGYYDC